MELVQTVSQENLLKKEFVKVVIIQFVLLVKIVLQIVFKTVIILV